MTDPHPAVTLPGLYRAPMRARSIEAGRYTGARLAVTHGRVGIGEPLSSEPESLEDAVRALAAGYSEKSGRMLRRFAAVPPGALIWTRTGDDVFHLGSGLSPWYYEPDEGDRSGICQVRNLTWIDRAFDSGSVPSRVIFAFDRGGRNFQRIRDQDAEMASRELWDRYSG